MLKKLSFMVLVLTCIFGIKAMEQPVTVEQVIEADNVQVLRELVESGQFDPSQALLGAGYLDWDVYDIRKSALAFAAYQCSLDSVRYLLSLNPSDNQVGSALYEALRNYVLSPSSERHLQCNQIMKLIMAEAQKRGLERAIQAGLNSALFDSIGNVDPEGVKYFLSLGADRTWPPLTSKINTLKGADLALIGKDPAKLKQMIHVLRTYAPDLKTRAALNILNQVREGQMTRRDIEDKKLPQELLELIAKLANVDREALAKWIALGMPTSRELFERQSMEQQECD